MAELDRPKLTKNSDVDKTLKEFEDDREIPGKITTDRENLPIFAKREEILETIRSHQIIMIKGETGCGKTTQVSQYILEDRIQKSNGSMTNILVAQPRRISAVAVANRVAEERAEIIGERSNGQVCRMN